MTNKKNIIKSEFKLLGFLYGEEIYTKNDLKDTGNLLAIKFREMFEERERIKKLSWWRRLFNKF
jgi:hypothetical protein